MLTPDFIRKFGTKRVAEKRSVMTGDVAVVFERTVATIGHEAVDSVYAWWLKDKPDIGGSSPCTGSSSFTNYQTKIIEGRPFGEYL